MRILITAGPTREPIDAVRFISNRSSGMIGIALAQAALERGHQVTLLMGPAPAAAQLPRPNLVLGVGRFESSAELEQLLDQHFPECDVLVMAAAVADYRPAATAPGKPPARRDRPWPLPLEPTPDLVAQLARRKRPQQRIIAFALEEPDRLEARALEKMQRKGVDAVVANPLETMESDAIEPLWLTGGSREAPGRMSKTDFARWLVQRIERWN